VNKKLLFLIGAGGVIGVAYVKRDTLRQYAMLGKAVVLDPLLVHYGSKQVENLLGLDDDDFEEEDPDELEGELSRYGAPFDIEGELGRYQEFEADAENPIDLPPSRYPDRVPMHRWRARARIDEFRQNFYHGGAGRMPSNEEIAQFMDTSPAKVAEILRDTENRSGPDSGSLEGPDIPD
jgi:hypothetical protein